MLNLVTISFTVHKFNTHTHKQPKVDTLKLVDKLKITEK